MSDEKPKEEFPLLTAILVPVLAAIVAPPLARFLVAVMFDDGRPEFSPDVKRLAAERYRERLN